MSLFDYYENFIAILDNSVKVIVSLISWQKQFLSNDSARNVKLFLLRQLFIFKLELVSSFVIKFPNGDISNIKLDKNSGPARNAKLFVLFIKLSVFELELDTLFAIIFKNGHFQILCCFRILLLDQLEI